MQPQVASSLAGRRIRPENPPPMLLVAEPVLGAEEKAALLDVIDSGWITMGERVRSFETAFAAAHGVGDCVAVNSCTAALHLILDALGVGPGDEVLVPSLTFVATSNAVLYVGATPVFVDINGLDSPHISLEDAASKCTPRTKAVILMHYAGYIVDRVAWREFAEKRNILLIEDAAHAAGAEGVGTIGHATAFSFYGNKNMTTAEGGAVFAQDASVLERVRQMRGHGMTTGTFQRLSSSISTYDVTCLGFNYRMDELRAAIGLVQLRHLAAWNEHRRKLTLQYKRRLAENCPGVTVPFAGLCNTASKSSSHHVMPIVLPSGIERQKVVDHMRAAGVQTTIHYPPAHMFTYYSTRFPGVSLEITEDYARRELTLPLHPKMDQADVERVVVTLGHALA